MPDAPRPRWYEDACAAAHALDLAGERWALLVIRELLFGPKRFNDLRASLPGISASVLTQRLESLEAACVLVRRRLPPPASVQVYELTEWGYESEPIFHALGRWGARSPRHDPTLPFSAASLMLSMRTMLDPQLAAETEACIGFRIAEENFAVRLARGQIDVERHDLQRADVIFAGSASTIAAAIYRGQTLDTLENAGLLRIEGDRDLAKRVVTLFPLPPKAPPPA